MLMEPGVHPARRAGIRRNRSLEKPVIFRLQRPYTARNGFRYHRRWNVRLTAVFTLHESENFRPAGELDEEIDDPNADCCRFRNCDGDSPVNSGVCGGRQRYTILLEGR